MRREKSEGILVTVVIDQNLPYDPVAPLGGGSLPIFF